MIFELGLDDKRIKTVVPNYLFVKRSIGHGQCKGNTNHSSHVLIDNRLTGQ